MLSINEIPSPQFPRAIRILAQDSQISVDRTDVIGSNWGGVDDQEFFASSFDFFSLLDQLQGKRGSFDCSAETEVIDSLITSSDNATLEALARQCDAQASWFYARSQEVVQAALDPSTPDYERQAEILARSSRSTTIYLQGVLANSNAMRFRFTLQVRNSSPR